MLELYFLQCLPNTNNMFFFKKTKGKKVVHTQLNVIPPTEQTWCSTADSAYSVLPFHMAHWAFVPRSHSHCNTSYHYMNST